MSEGHLFTIAQIKILGIMHKYNMSITTILDMQPIKTYINLVQERILASR